jgi:hypothetical protein
LSATTARPAAQGTIRVKREEDDAWFSKAGRFKTCMAERVRRNADGLSMIGWASATSCAGVGAQKRVHPSGISP